MKKNYNVFVIPINKTRMCGEDTVEDLSSVLHDVIPKESCIDGSILSMMYPVGGLPVTRTALPLSSITCFCIETRQLACFNSIRSCGSRNLTHIHKDQMTNKLEDNALKTNQWLL